MPLSSASPNATPTPSQRTTRTGTNVKETSTKKAHRLQTTDDAENYLTSKGWHPDTGPTLDSIAQTALLLASCGPSKDITDGLRAIGLILKEAAFKTFGDNIIDNFMEKAHIVTANLVDIGEKVDKQLNLAMNLDNLVEDASKELRETTETLKNTVECLARNGEESRNDIDKAAERLTETIEQIPELITTNTEPQTHPFTPFTPSFAAITATPPPNSAKLARNRLQDRQILLDKAPGLESHGIASLIDVEAIAKGNEAIRLTFGDTDEGAQIKVAGIRKLRNGGVVLEMNTREAAIKVKERKNDFEKNLGGTSILKNREWATLAEYVPITHKTDSIFERRDIEISCNLDRNSLTSTRWIKPTEKRSHTQQTAHLILRWTSSMAANEAIKNGIIVNGKRANVRKLDPEPRRCLNCQKFGTGHLAANCPSKTVCGTCGKEHRSSQCYEADPTNHYCENCHKKGHASWSRDCPDFTKRRIGMQNEEGKYRYYVVEDEEWTWERVDGYNTGAATGYGHGGYGRERVERTNGTQPGEGRNAMPRERTAGRGGRERSTERGRGANSSTGRYNDGWDRQSQLIGFGFEPNYAHQTEPGPIGTQQ